MILEVFKKLWWGGWVVTIRKKFRPVKVSLLPIVLLIKEASAPVLIERLSLSLNPLSLLHPHLSLACSLKERKLPITVSSSALPSSTDHIAINIVPMTVKRTSCYTVIINTSSALMDEIDRESFFKLYFLPFEIMNT